MKDDNTFDYRRNANGKQISIEDTYNDVLESCAIGALSVEMKADFNFLRTQGSDFPHATDLLHFFVSATIVLRLRLAQLFTPVILLDPFLDLKRKYLAS